MSLTINLEIGHDASWRSKETPEGFTQDWEVYVKGCNGADIQHYVEKVVFHLHETFAKPRRVVKEPPYSLKASGYASFILLIDIYLKNSGEPKKIRFNYDLVLATGPTIHRFQREKFTFTVISDDFRSKLLKGGAVPTAGAASQDPPDRPAPDDKGQMASKSKAGAEPVKKHRARPEESMPDTFRDLFGTPITKTSRVPDPPKPKEPPKGQAPPAKADNRKEKEKNKTKSPYKDKDKDKPKDKDKSDSSEKEKKFKDERKEKKDKKDRDRSKEKKDKKDKERDKSPPARPKSASPKRSPKRHSPSPQPKHSSSKEKDVPKDKEKDKESRDRREEKKSKKDKHKEHKENKHKDHKEKSREKSKDTIKEKDSSPAPVAPPPQKPDKKEKLKDKEESKEQQQKEEKSQSRSDRSEDKPKHKHKKKDRERKEKREEKSHKTEKKSEKSSPNVVKENGREAQAQAVSSSREKEVDKSNLFGSPKSDSPVPPDVAKKDRPPLDRLVDSDTSDSERASTREPSPAPPAHPPAAPSPQPPPRREPDHPRARDEGKRRERREKKKEKKGERDAEKKRKRKSDQQTQVEPDEPPEKVPKEEDTNNNSDDERKVSSSEDANPAPPPVPAAPVKDEAEEYMNMLRELQQKIMGLRDNSDLQKVVQLIAETGKYEVSAHTFDFDLCLLDRSTVRRLQDFFSMVS